MCLGVFINARALSTSQGFHYWFYFKRSNGGLKWIAALQSREEGLLRPNIHVC